jgi:hypothetical protein
MKKNHTASRMEYLRSLMPPVPIAALWLLAAVLSLTVGGIVTSDGVHGWDDFERRNHSTWLLAHYGVFQEYQGPYLETLTSITDPPLEFVLGVATDILVPFLRDPYWVRHSIVFAMWPMGLLLLYHLLRKAGVRLDTAILCIALLFGMIRVGGSSLFNTKDFPFAMVYLNATVAQWLLLRALWDALQKNGRTVHLLLGIGIVGILPYIFHRPDVSHFVFAIAIIGLFALAPGIKIRWVQRVRLLIVPSGAAFLTLMALYPPAWEVSIWGLMQGGYHWSSRFEFYSLVRVYGQTFSSLDLPWWYSLGFFPLIAHPLVFIGAAAGLISLLFIREKTGKPLRIPLGHWSIPCSLLLWFFVYVVYIFAALLIIQPYQYDEERHMMFAYPHVFLLGGLGLGWLDKGVKRALAIVIVISALVTYLQWGKYSYIYKSPLVGNTHESQFTGDYWGVCTGDAVRMLPKLVPPGSTVVSFIPHLEFIQYTRLRESLLFRDPEFGEYTFIGHIPARPFVVISINKVGMGMDVVQNDLQAGTAKLLWQRLLPNGDPACMMVLYE